ncbi:SusC/RagA family TonB-linked outer membrane protein [Sphingobacterium lumbrici]|uniref:SusC/RagA family TonB-linked outer membrane protein n=1 Tax=Sphingobacterium lumbrici TaxID=2559600 RepID=UPI001127AC67|nr:SusC/RagA family TonB-linked outer membrane protein [Sphingobacterium lumbrici]
MNKNLYIAILLVFYSVSTVAQSTAVRQDTLLSGAISTEEFRKTKATTTITSEALDKNATPNVYNTLYGLLPGLSVMQNTGWDDNATLIVRGRGSLNGIAPLIVVDGFARPMEFLNLQEIETISVLKDGAATAKWGGRGANGVIEVTTKRGKRQKMRIGAEYKYGLGVPVNQPRFADGYSYANAQNEALRLDGLQPLYGEQALEAFKTGSNPNIYPNTNWMDEGLRDFSKNSQLDLTFRGGGDRLRYFTMLGYKNDMGILNPNYTQYSNRYDAQMKKYDLNLRMNLDADVTPTTTVQVSLLGMIRQRNRPDATEATLFSSLYATPSAAFPVRTSRGIWGGDNVRKLNPIAQIADIGYYRTDQRMLQADLRLKQDLKFITPGLRAEAAVAYDNNATYKENGSKSYRYEVNTLVMNSDFGHYEEHTQRFGDDSALKVSNGGLASQYLRSNIEAKLSYDYAVGKHVLAFAALYNQWSYVSTGRATSKYRQFVTATGGYSYADRYLIDVLVNRYGTSVLPKEDRFITYPAVSAAWVISKEQFMAPHTQIGLLKLRASWGRSGYDDFEYYLDRQYWQGSGSYYFQDGNVSTGGITEGRLPVTNVMCEMSDKYNVGLDMQMFGKLSLAIDAYYDNRKNILINGSDLVSSMLGVSASNMFAGKVKSRGLDAGLIWKDQKNAFNYYVGGTFSFVKSQVLENGEGYQPYPYLSAKGYPIGQTFGLEAIGYFDDEQDIANSAKQVFSAVRPGDIKYKDQNGDQLIDVNDRIAIGYSSSIPEIYYGINAGVECKGFGIDLLFQGVGNYSKMLNAANVYWPLRNNTNISTWYLEDKIRWTEETKDIANVPRLTTQDNANNFQNSTQWLVNGAYLKLRNVNIYYNLPKPITSKLGFQKLQVFVRGNNLFSRDHVDYLNSEDLTVNYPDISSVYMGVNVNF